jgi:hypothetical protein
MFYLNHNNMEKMFREAAENYQLSTDAAFDWEKVEHALHGDADKEQQPPAEKEKKKRRFVIWYLLLIPLGWFANYFWNNQLAVKHSQKDTVLQSAIIKEEPGKKIIPENTARQKNNGQPAIPGALILPENKSNTSVSNMPGIKATKNKKFIVPALSALPDLNIAVLTKANNLNLKKEANGSKKENKLKVTTAKTSTLIEPGSKKIPESSSEKKNIVIKKKQPGFYAGLLFAPDITFIKFQKTPGIGHSFGLVAGYKINNQWSIETGVLSGIKKYYTKGAYFDKSNVADLYNKDLVSVDGDCEMIEIPINARFTFATTNKGKWTAALGTASYFMKEEYYSYYIMNNGQNEETDHTYHTSSANWLAAINLAAGYQRSIGKNLDLRLEPYFKIPLSGTGTGNLPLSSTGINIGITKLFH